MRAALLLLCLALAGCATNVEVKYVDVPIAVSCVQPAEIPPAPADWFGRLPGDAQIDEQVRALLIDREADRVYGKRLRAKLEACVTTAATTSAERAPSPVKP